MNEELPYLPAVKTRGGIAYRWLNCSPKAKFPKVDEQAWELPSVLWKLLEEGRLAPFRLKRGVYMSVEAAFADLEQAFLAFVRESPAYIVRYPERARK